MKLYYAKGTCALAPHIILKELGVAHEAVRVDLASKRLPDGSDYHQVNAVGYVPALELDDGDVLIEGVAILMYLSDLTPQLRLQGRDHYHLLSRLTFIATELHKAYSPLFNKTLGEETKAYFRDKLHQRLAAFDGMLGEREYLMPTGFSVADAYAYNVIGWSKNVGVTVPPRVQAYLDRIHARPATTAARLAESPRAV